jgi:hypothetical protein
MGCPWSAGSLLSCLSEAVPSCTVHLPQEELLVEAFQPFGRLQSVKLLRDKGGEAFRTCFVTETISATLHGMLHLLASQPHQLMPVYASL